MEFLEYYDTIEDVVQVRFHFSTYLSTLLSVYTPESPAEIYAVTNSPELLKGEWIELSDDDIDALLSRM